MSEARGTLVSVDASVAVKWVVSAEGLTTEARALLHDVTLGDQRFVGPPHLHGEVTNALYQRWRTTDPTKHLDQQEVLDALQQFLRYRVTVASPPDLYERAFDFARAHGLPSIYDAMYAVLAQMLTIEVWTADQRLLSLLAGNAPWVRVIGDYVSPSGGGAP